MYHHQTGTRFIMGSKYDNLTYAEILDQILTHLPTAIFGATDEDIEQQQEQNERALSDALHFLEIDIGLNMGLFLLNIVSFFLTLFFCTSLMQKILLTKSVAVALQCVVETIIIADVLLHFDTKIELTENKVGAFGTAGEILRSIERVFGGYHQFLTFFFHFELHTIVCKMEKHPKSGIRAMKIGGIALAMISFVVGIDTSANILLTPFHNDQPLLYIVKGAVPLFSIMIFGFCIATLYYNHRIAVALKNSDDFRHQCGIQGRQRNSKFLFAVIRTTAAFQFVYFVLHVVESVLASFLGIRILTCMEEAKTFYETCVCSLDTKNMLYNKEIIIKPTWSQLFEQVITTILIVFQRKAIKD